MESIEQNPDMRNDFESDIQTPEEGPFKISFKTLNFQMSRKDLEEDEENELFLENVVSIIEKHKRNEIMETGDEQKVSDQLCEEIHEMSEKHAASKRFNIYSESELETIPQQNICSCGCNQAEGHPLPFCTNEVEEYFFGPAIILFFFFIRKISILVIVIIFTYAIFSLVTNILTAPPVGEKCKENPGSLSFLCEFKYLSTVRNKASHQDLMQIQVWLGFLLCIIWVLGLRIIQDMGRELNRKVDDQLDSSSDYVIKVSNLPFGQYSEKQLLKYVTSLWKKFKGKDTVPSIKSVQIIYSMKKPRELINQIIKESLSLVPFIQNFQQIQMKKSNKSYRSEFQSGKLVYLVNPKKKEQYLQKKAHLLELLEQLQAFRDRFIIDPQFRKKLATDMAFIQFKEPNQQTEFLKKTRQYRLTIFGEIKEYIKNKIWPSEDSFLFKGSVLRITRAPEPSDIHWLNCEKKISFWKLFFVWLLTFGVVGVSFGALILIKYLRRKFPQLNSLSILISISLQVFNRIIWNFLVSFVDFQKNNTVTDNIISVVNKSAFATAVNTTVLPIITNIVMNDNLYGPEGLVGIVLDFQFTVFFMMINLNLINFPYQMKRLCLCIPYIRNYIIRSRSKVIGSIESTQEVKEVLEYYEPPPFPVASAYVYITTIIYHAIFFVHIQPTLLIYLLFNLGCFYLVLKYLLIRRCKIPELFDFLLFETSFSILQYVPLLYGLGSLFFISIIGDGDGKPYTSLNSLSIPCFLSILLWIFDHLNPKRIFSSIASRLAKYFQTHEEEAETQLSEKNSTEMSNDKLTKATMEVKEISQSRNKGISKRRECYYVKSGLNDLLSYESKLTEIKRMNYFCQMQNRSKLFCEKFFLKEDQKPLKVESLMPMAERPRRKMSILKPIKMRSRKKIQLDLIQETEENMRQTQKFDEKKRENVGRLISKTLVKSSSCQRKEKRCKRQKSSQMKVVTFNLEQIHEILETEIKEISGLSLKVKSQSQM